MSNQLTIKIEMILHATENLQKITDSFLDMFKIKENEISMQNISGHFGNPISMLRLEIKNKMAQEFVKKLVDMIPNDQMIDLLENIEDYIEISVENHIECSIDFYKHSIEICIEWLYRIL